jgi:hypothetical protein
MIYHFDAGMYLHKASSLLLITILETKSSRCRYSCMEKDDTAMILDDFVVVVVAAAKVGEHIVQRVDVWRLNIDKL